MKLGLLHAYTHTKTLFEQSFKQLMLFNVFQSHPFCNENKSQEKCYQSNAWMTLISLENITIKFIFNFNISDKATYAV